MIFIKEGDGKLRPVTVAKATPKTNTNGSNPAVWKCEPCASGAGTCCTRLDLPKVAKAPEPKPVLNIWGEPVKRQVEPPGPVVKAEVAPTFDLEALRARESVPSHLRGAYDRQQSGDRLRALEARLKEMTR